MNKCRLHGDAETLYNQRVYKVTRTSCATFVEFVQRYHNGTYHFRALGINAHGVHIDGAAGANPKYPDHYSWQIATNARRVSDALENPGSVYDDWNA